jgi:MFS transporter, DHA2 family, methylenomycin A resistance protein
VLGVALFGSFVAEANAFIDGARQAFVISAVVLVGAAIATLIGGRVSHEGRVRG